MNDTIELSPVQPRALSADDLNAEIAGLAPHIENEDHPDVRRRYVKLRRELWTRGLVTLEPFEMGAVELRAEIAELDDLLSSLPLNFDQNKAQKKARLRRRALVAELATREDEQ